MDSEKRWFVFRTHLNYANFGKLGQSFLNTQLIGGPFEKSEGEEYCRDLIKDKCADEFYGLIEYIGE